MLDNSFEAKITLLEIFLHPYFNLSEYIKNWTSKQKMAAKMVQQYNHLISGTVLKWLVPFFTSSIFKRLLPEIEWFEYSKVWYKNC
jgi:hypothetical protein